MSKTKKIKAQILSHDSGGAYVIIPFDVEAYYGKKRVKILANIEGEQYRGSLVRMGSPDHILLIRKDIRQKIGKQAGDIVAITLQEDTAVRVIDVPKDFQALLEKNPSVHTFFKKLSYTHQREYVEWITSAKREQTRINRINKAIELMQAGKKSKY